MQNCGWMQQFFEELDGIFTEKEERRTAPKTFLKVEDVMFKTAARRGWLVLRCGG